MKISEDEPKKGAPAFMNTYGDLMTLLLTFFVLLFSMSSVDVSKFKAIIASFEGGTGMLSGGDTVQENTNMLGNGVKQFPEKGNKKSGTENTGNKDADKELEKMKENLEKYIQDQKLEEKITVEKSGDEIILRFDDILLFDTGKADIKAGAVPVLDKVGLKLREYLEQGYRIRLEGHTDNKPIKTIQFPSNWELSAARAIAVAKFFIHEMNLLPSKISTEGFGENAPKGDNVTPQGRAMNRRVEIKISKDDRS